MVYSLPPKLHRTVCFLSSRHETPVLLARNGRHVGHTIGYRPFCFLISRPRAMMFSPLFCFMISRPRAMMTTVSGENNFHTQCALTCISWGIRCFQSSSCLPLESCLGLFIAHRYLQTSPTSTRFCEFTLSRCPPDSETRKTVAVANRTHFPRWAHFDALLL